MLKNQHMHNYKIKCHARDRVTIVNGVEIPSVPFKFNEQMYGASVLTQSEIKYFKTIHNDNGPNEMPDHRSSVILCLSKFGFGVKAAKDIPKNALLGFYYGRLCRSLPPDSRYSFIVNTDHQSPLFLSCEMVSDRSILA